jgi:transposase-like protein
MPQLPSSRSRSHPRRPLIGANTERCIYCEGTRITREGKRYKKLETIQLWYCHDCGRVFTRQIVQGKRTPLKVILESLCLYYRGETRRRVAQRIKERFGIRVSPRTLLQWLAEYRPLTTYARLRSHALTRFTPHTLIRSTRLHHQQVYHYRIHQGKLAYLLNTAEHQAFRPIETYLTEMAASCPHPLFQQEHRASASASAFDLTGVEITEKQNLAPRIAGLILQTVTHNTRRYHPYAAGPGLRHPALV